MIVKVSAQSEIYEISMNQDDIMTKLKNDLYHIAKFLEENDDISNIAKIDVSHIEIDVSTTNDQSVFDINIIIDFDFVDTEDFNERDQDVYSIIESEVYQFMSHVIGTYEDSNGNQFEVVEIDLHLINVSEY